jgi:hypothetical protein
MPVMTTDAPDFAAMTMEEMDEWIDSEEAKTPFKSFDLSTDEGRQALLRKYYRIGNTSLFEAVSHVWASLNEPKAAHCTLMGLIAGTGGKGKRGLVLALQKFLAEALDSVIPIPDRAAHSSLDEWHQASLLTYDQEEDALCELLCQYSKILDGGVPASASLPSDALIIHGPWSKHN